MPTVKELNAKCKKLGLKGYTRFSKVELEKLIKKHSKSKQKIKINKDDQRNIIEWMSSIIYNSYEKSLIAKQALQAQKAVIEQDAQKAFNIIYKMKCTNTRHHHPKNFSLHALNRIIKDSKNI